jgi:hypothetical protein
LWVEFFAPVLGAFEALKENHWPVATINDRQLRRAIPPETRVVILPHARELDDEERSVLVAFESGGGAVVRLDSDSGWHLKTDKPQRKRDLMARIDAAIPSPPIRARGPAAMHAVFHGEPTAEKNVVCLMNTFGWFRSEREPSEASKGWEAPPACSGVVVEVSGTGARVKRAVEAVTGRELVVDHNERVARIRVPEFAVMACVVIERDAEGQ